MILSGIATSIMTVVSIVFAILLMTLTLASTQFSPRILVNFVRDRTTQWTLGVFLGTFSYCMAALPAARSLPRPFVPVATATGAMLLALVCVGWLIYFINHISRSISVNHIVDRIARETELVIDEFMPYSRGPFPLHGPQRALCARRRHRHRQPAVRLYPLHRHQSPRRARARRTASACGWSAASATSCRLAFRSCSVSQAERLPADRALHLLGTFDIGPTRTMQQDVEFGIIQIVDIALRAISPAINDPSTAISCVDQLSRIVIRWIGRVPPPSHYYAPPHVLRLTVPWLGFQGLLDTAFEQIRHYAVADVAVSLRLLRAFDDIASTTPHAELKNRFSSAPAALSPDARTACRKTSWPNCSSVSRRSRPGSRLRAERPKSRP